MEHFERTIHSDFGDYVMEYCACDKCIGIFRTGETIKMRKLTGKRCKEWQKILAKSSD